MESKNLGSLYKELRAGKTALGHDLLDGDNKAQVVKGVKPGRPDSDQPHLRVLGDTGDSDTFLQTPSYSTETKLLYSPG